MDKPVSFTSKDKIHKPSIFNLLKPYYGIVILLIIMALMGSAVNMLIPKIIAQGIDAFSSNYFDMKSVVVEFLIAASAIFIFTSDEHI